MHFNTTYVLIQLPYYYLASFHKWFGSFCMDTRYIFLSNHNVHKSFSGLCFCAPDPLIEQFHLNLLIKGSGAPKTKAIRTFMNVVIWRKSISKWILLKKKILSTVDVITSFTHFFWNTNTSSYIFVTLYLVMIRTLRQLKA